MRGVRLNCRANGGNPSVKHFGGIFWAVTYHSKILYIEYPKTTATNLLYCQIILTVTKRFLSGTMIVDMNGKQTRGV